MGRVHLWGLVRCSVAPGRPAGVLGCCTHPALGGLQNSIDKRMACVVGWLDLGSCTEQLASIQCGVVVRHGCYTQRPHTASAHETAWYNRNITHAGWHWVGRVGWSCLPAALCHPGLPAKTHTVSVGRLKAASTSGLTTCTAHQLASPSRQPHTRLH